MAGYSDGYLAATSSIGAVLKARTSATDHHILLDKATPEGLRFSQVSKCVGEMSNIQTAAIVDKYLKDHPELWDKPIYRLIDEAITKACSLR